MKSKKMKLIISAITLYFGFTFFAVSGVEAAPKIKINNYRVKQGETANLPIKFNKFPNDTYAVYLKINYDPEVVVEPEVIATSSSDRKMVSNITAPGELLFSLASTQPLSRKGVLANLRFRVGETGSRTTKVILSDAKINEADLNIKLKNARLTIVSAYRNPFLEWLLALLEWFRDR